MRVLGDFYGYNFVIPKFYFFPLFCRIGIGRKLLRLFIKKKKNEDFRVMLFKILADGILFGTSAKKRGKFYAQD